MFRVHNQCIILTGIGVGVGVGVALVAILVIILIVVLVLVVIRWRAKKPYDMHQGKWNLILI